MRTLGEIINLCKDGGKPTIDEARLAICAMDSLMVFDSMFYARRARREMEGKKPDLFSAEHAYTERFNRVRRALKRTPIEWLGTHHNPDNPDVQKRRKNLEQFIKKICP